MVPTQAAFRTSTGWGVRGAFLPQPRSAGHTVLPVADYDLYVTFAGTQNPIIDRTVVSLPASSIRTLILGNPDTAEGDFVLINSDDSPPAQ